MFFIALKQSAINYSIDIHYKLEIEVQGTSMHLRLQLLYKVFDCHWLCSLSRSLYTFLTWCVSSLNQGWRFHVHVAVQFRWYSKVSFAINQLTSPQDLHKSLCLLDLHSLSCSLNLILRKNILKVAFFTCGMIGSSWSNQFRPSSKCILFHY